MRKGSSVMKEVVGENKPVDKLFWPIQSLQNISVNISTWENVMLTTLKVNTKSNGSLNV